MPTTITRFVNTASSGGDGTTNGTSGSTAAYASLNAALDAQERDLVAADEIALFLCSGTSTADTTAPTFGSAWVCDSTRNIIVRANTAHEATLPYDTNRYRIEGSAASGAPFVNFNASTQVLHVRFEGIQFQYSVTGTTGFRAFWLITALAASSRLHFERCVIKAVANGGYTGAAAWFLRSQDADPDVRFTSCVMYDGAQGGIYNNSSTHTCYIFNCTFVGQGTAISIGSGTSVRIRNCVFDGCTTDISGTGHADTNYNHTTKASGLAGANSTHSNTFTFVDSGAKNYHLASGDTGAKDKGEDLTGVTGLLTVNDIDNVARSGTWDAGADEFVADAPGPTLYFLGTANGDGWGDVQLGGSAPSTATMSTGWTVAGTAADNYSEMQFGAERAANTFTGTVAPGSSPNNTLKNGWRYGPTGGIHSAGSWPMSVAVRAVDAGGTQDGAIRVRFFRSSNADGSSSTELGSVVQLSTVTNLTTSADQTCTGTLTGIPEIAAGQYLFFCCAWRITGQAS